MSLPDPASQRGAILALGVTIEGCSEYMGSHMSQVWPVIEAGLSNPDGSVRRAACVAVSCMCDWLEEHCVKQHGVLLPVSLYAQLSRSIDIHLIRLLGDHEFDERSSYTDARMHSP